MVDVAKFKDEEELGYRVNVIGRNFVVTEAVKNYIWGQLGKIDRFHKHILDIHVNLEIQRMEHSCILIMVMDHLKIKVSAISSDMYVSINEAFDRLKEKIRRWKDRIQYHHNKPIEAIDLLENVIRRPYDEVEEYNAEIEKALRTSVEKDYQLPQVIATERRPLKTLTTGEALMKIDLSEEDFVIYRGEEDRKIKVIYRRSDGNYGMVVPE